VGDRDVDEEDEIEIRQAPRAPTEGVRIIGAEEAQAAIETGQAAGTIFSAMETAMTKPVRPDHWSKITLSNFRMTSFQLI